MKAVVQRVTSASVVVASEVVGTIERGLVAFVGAGKGDTLASVEYMVDKILALRIFEDDSGKMSRALADVSGGLLVVSQFTLYGDVTRGRRPSFDQAMEPAEAERLYEAFLARARERHPVVASGRFRADMRVLVANDGPVTIIVESPASRTGSSVGGSRG
jgi:D-tyrosyl-tRNA(Tyr) deacylase